MIRKCLVQGCRVHFETNERGKGKKKYCDEHRMIVRAERQKEYSRKNYLRRLA